ncbi:MAG: ferritin-like domain-containing protein [Candidatus Njordarchaeales archaeon]
MGYDSLKHANLLEALLALLEARAPLISEEESEGFINGIREHLEMEKEAIETYSKLLEKVEDQKTRLIIAYILEDEKRHHALLKKIEELIKKQTLTEEDVFELV